MMDYYYEITPDTTVFGRSVRYLARYNFHPGEASRGEFKLHNEAMQNSSRVWLQNSNGAYLVERNRREVLQPISEREFTWIKLQALDIETL
jgi:hypothetical protein